MTVKDEYSTRVLDTDLHRHDMAEKLKIGIYFKNYKNYKIKN